LAFHGTLCYAIDNITKPELEKIKIYKTKVKKGIIDRIVDDNTIIGKDLFKKETDINIFVGLKIVLETGKLFL
jgi:selenocysteine-specific elongation factor